MQMTTPRRRAFVSIAATIITLALGACASAPSRPMSGGHMATDTRALTIGFDNMARERVHVYLIGPQRAWFLGRVEAEAVVRLRIPDAALTEGSTMVRLVALAGERVTLEAARRASALTAAQPASAILSQRWKFARGELVALRR
jgi:hypothetical protein